MKNAILSLDIIGNPIEFNFGRRPRYQTLTGGCISLFIHALLLFVIYIYFRRLFIDRDCDTSTSDSFNIVYPAMNLAESEIYPIFVLGDTSLALIQFKTPAEAANLISISATNIMIDYQDLGD